MRRLITLITIVLTAMADSFHIAAETFEGYGSREEIVERLSRLPLVEIEGIWQFPATGQMIVIEREDREGMRFRVVACSSSGIGLENGTLLGYVVPSAKTGVFDATLAEIKPDGSLRSDPFSKKRTSRFTLNLSGGRLSLTPVSRGLRVNWWRLFPYMFRFSVRSYDDRQKGLDGCLRVWPRSVSDPPYQPRYL